MTMNQLVIIFAVCLVGAYCGVAVERTRVLPTQKAQGFACKSSDENLGLMRANEERVNYEPNFCGLAHCSSNGDIHYETCGVASAGPGCKIVTHSSRPYPACCPTVSC